MAPQPLALINARLVDPETGYDGPGSLVIADGLIADVVRRPAFPDLSADIEVIDCGGAMLAPGLVDIRVKTGEPGAETKETLKSAARAASRSARSTERDRSLGAVPLRRVASTLLSDRTAARSAGRGTSRALIHSCKW